MGQDGNWLVVRAEHERLCFSKGFSPDYEARQGAVFVSVLALGLLGETAVTGHSALDSQASSKTACVAGRVFVPVLIFVLLLKSPLVPLESNYKISARK